MKREARITWSDGEVKTTTPEEAGPVIRLRKRTDPAAAVERIERRDVGEWEDVTFRGDGTESLLAASDIAEEAGA